MIAEHAFTQDGRHLVIVDGFALTRVTFPNTVKTDESLAGDRLSLGGNHALIRVARTDRNLLRAVDSMLGQRWNPGDAGAFALLDEHDRAMRADADEVDVYASTQKKLGAFAWPKKLASIGAFDLGPTLPEDALARWAVAHDAESQLLAHYLSARGAVLVGRLKSARTMEPRFLVEVGRIVAPILCVADGAVFVGNFDRAAKQAVILRIDAENNVARRALQCLAAPVFSKTHWCWQRDERTVCRATFDTLDAPQLFELAKDARGAGSVMAHREQLWFLPGDGERLHDLRTRAVIDRKLEKKRAAVRTLIRKCSDKVDAWLAEEQGQCSIGSFVVEHESKLGDWSPRIDPGLATLSACFAVSDLLVRQWAKGERGLVIRRPSIEMRLAHTTLAHVRAAFSALERNGVSLEHALGGMLNMIEPRFEAPEGRRRSSKRAERPRLFDDDAAQVLLLAFFASQDPAERVALDSAAVDRWAKKKVTAESLIKLKFRERTSRKEPAVADVSLPAVIAYIALDWLGADALPVLARWMIEAPSNLIKESSHMVAVPLARMTQLYPATKSAVKAACKASGEHGASVLDSIESEW